MTTPGHYNEVVLVGDIRELYTDGNGAVIGVILVVNADEPCEVPVMFPANRRELLLFGQARWIEHASSLRPTEPSSLQGRGRLPRGVPVCDGPAESQSDDLPWKAAEVCAR